MSKKIWLNTKLVPDSQAKISIWDRGFLYGDGVYETVRMYAGKIFRPEHHWRRLDRSLKGIRLKSPWPHAALTKACLATARANGLQECLIRVTISRGIGELGYDPRSCKKPTLVVLAHGVRNDLAQLWKRGVKVSIPEVRRNSLRSLSPAVKHTNCLNGILAKMQSIEKGAFEAVFLNLDGVLAEGTISNVFVVQDGVLKTPSFDCGLLDGVTRGAVIEVAKSLGIPVSETRILPEDLLEADEAFLTSTTMETMPIVRVDRAVIAGGKPGPVTERLHAALRQLIRKELRLPESFLDYRNA